MVNNELLDFVSYVCNKAGFDMEKVKIIDYDLKRVYLAVDSESNNYNIRLWDIHPNVIRYSLFELVKDYGMPIIEIQYYFFN